MGKAKLSVLLCKAEGFGCIYQLYPLYPEELQFKLEHSFDELMERLDADDNMIIDIRRKNHLSQGQAEKR